MLEPISPAHRGRQRWPALLLLTLLLACSPLRPTVAQEAAPPGGGGGGEPVEIVADSLVVEQEKQLATFTGNVDAVQGDLRLRADRLLVFYNEGDDGQQQPQQAQSSEQSIRRIEAAGNVFLTRPGETAKGDRGTYEPATGAVTLEGNVVLTRDQNVIRGARLESNRQTGVSTVFAAAPGARGRPEQRVRALFVQQNQGGGNAAGGKAAPAPAASGKAP